MSYERAWFIYAGAPGNELVHPNYFMLIIVLKSLTLMEG